MPRWKTPRWMLGASALVALAVAGCGAAASHPTLHTASEKRLLSLVARAQKDASAHNGSAVHADLGQFVADVQTLTTSDQLSGSTARKLDREARATAAQAAEQLHPRATGKAPATTTSTQAVIPPPSTVPVHTTPSPPDHSAVPPEKKHDKGPAGGNTEPKAPSDSPGHGHGHGHDGPATGDAKAATQAAIARAWARWWNHVTGGGGD